MASVTNGVDMDRVFAGHGEVIGMIKCTTRSVLDDFGPVSFVGNLDLDHVQYCPGRSPIGD